MRIGIDIDGVITNLEVFELEYASKFIKKTGIGIMNDLSKYSVKEAFHWNEEEEDEFWEWCIQEFVENKPRTFASEVINKLKEENEIYIITARTLKELDNMQEVTKKFLQKYNINYDKIIFADEDKLQTCIEQGIDLMIEDKPSNVMKISTKIPVLCMDARYNRECEGENITRVFSWYNVLEKIEEM